MALLRQGYGGRANALDKAVRAQGGSVVKPQQVKAMILAARRAYQEQSKLGLVDYGVDFDAWRRATLHDITGAAAPSSFRAVTQRDFAAVMEYFRELAGGVAERSSAIKSGDEERRAKWALRRVEEETAEAFGGVEGARRYADALFKKIHRTDRYAATAKKIWAVIFTMRGRAKARRSDTGKAGGVERRAKTALGARGTAGVLLSPPDGSKRFPAFSRGL